MGTVFEELIRRFNEENNEEAGEHFTPRDVVTLMADLIMRPVAVAIADGTYLIYDGACGTGGMLTVAEERLQEIASDHGKRIAVELYGQEVNGETWAISKADQLIKGDDADHIAHGSTLADDAFPTMTFDFMLSNPPYGKAWGSDLTRLGGDEGKKGVKDPRFVIEHAGDPEYSLLTRSSDGQLMFLANKLAKMKHDTPLGSRIAEVHNGSSLFTGDAGQGESNIRRWIIENDWLEAIIALPNNMFYNTGIATYIWVLTNRKEEKRRGKVQLIDATKQFTPRRKNLGQKNADLSETDQQAILDQFLAFDESESSKIFPNAAFGYRKITVERPLRLKVNLTRATIAALRESGRDDELADAMERLLERAMRDARHLSYSQVPISLDLPGRWSAKREKAYREFFCERDGDGEPVVRTYLDEELTDAQGRESWDSGDIPLERRLQGVGIWCPPIPYGAIGQNPFPGLATFEADPALRDTEQIPLTETVEDFIAREVLPYAPDAWVAEGSEKIGYEISFTRYFYTPQQLRTLAEIEADIRALEAETEGLLEEILVGVEA
jgi:type I restriction enzyme M protein